MQRFSKASPDNSNHFLDRLPFIEDGDGPAGVVLERQVRVDAEHVIDRGQHVGRQQRPLHRMLGLGVGGADHLPAAQAAAGQQHRDGVAPVIAARNRNARLARCSDCGVRPNSPITTTSTRSSRPRSSRSSSKAADGLVERPAACSRGRP